jgi:sugar (pentulose or hexulose) kinase
MIYRVMMTGDFVTYALTGEESLSTSDALSNGLLDQGTKQPARPVIERAGLVSSWFPPVVQSGAFVGVVRRAPVKNGWEAVAEVLKGWRIVAGLGDNHANAVGAGLDDFSTIAISGGSSGTVTRICRPGTATEGKAASFEYFNNTLLLRMLADCAVSYNRFLDLHSLRGGSHWELNANALAANPNNLLFVDQRDTGEKREEVYPKGWDKLTVGEQVASMQASIAVLMLRLVEEQMDEVKTPPITRFVISGGMSQSEFLQGVLAMGLKWLAGPTCDVLVSARTGSLANKAAVLGAMFTAMAGTKGYPSLSDVVDKLCTLRLIQTYPVALEWFFVEFV